jgi:hypothetical protein
MELEPYKGVLEFISEYQLTSEPLRIDLVIVVKEPGTVIERNKDPDAAAYLYAMLLANAKILEPV